MNASSDAPALPTQGRLMGIDPGAKRVGIAISNAEQTIASPLEVYTRKSEQVDANHLRSVVAEYSPVGLVVGLPVHMSGDEGEQARRARTFGTWLAEITGLPVVYWDERFTSWAAEEHLIGAELTRKKRKERIDKLAAQILLQAYLDSPNRGQQKF